MKWIKARERDAKHAKTHDKPKRKHKDRVLFYIKQSFKAFIILILGAMPVDFINGYATNIAINMGNMTKEDYFLYTSNLNIYSLVAAGICILAIYAALFKVKWTYTPHGNEK